MYLKRLFFISGFLLLAGGLQAFRPEANYGTQAYALAYTKSYLHSFDKSENNAYQPFETHDEIIDCAHKWVTPVWKKAARALDLSRAIHDDDMMKMIDEQCLIHRSRQGIKLKRRVIVLDDAALFDIDEECESTLEWMLKRPVFFKNFMMVAHAYRSGRPIILIVDVKDAERPDEPFWASMGLWRNGRGKCELSLERKYDWDCYERLKKTAKNCIKFMRQLDDGVLELMRRSIYPVLLRKTRLDAFMQRYAKEEEGISHASSRAILGKKQKDAAHLLFAKYKKDLPEGWFSVIAKSCGIRSVGPLK